MRKLSICTLGVCALALVGCVDNNYDLSDIDTTARVNVENLVVPLNMDEVTLKSVLDLKETSKIKIVEVGGDSIYALVENGSFKSSPIKVDNFKTKSPNINPIKDKLNLTETAAGVKVRESGAATSEPVAYYELSNVSTKFHVSADKIHKAVKDFQFAKVGADFSISLDVSELTKNLSRIHCEDVKLLLIKGLSISKIEFQGAVYQDFDYDMNTGILNLSELDIEFPNGIFTFKATVDGLDATIAEIDFDSESHTLTFESECKVLSGRVMVYQDDIKASSSVKGREGRKTAVSGLPQSVSFTGSFDLSDIDMKEFTGEFEYAIENLKVNPVQLTDIPDVFNQKGTDIRLKNPQLYLSIDNPLAEEYGIKAETGLTLTSVNGSVQTPYTADEQLQIDQAHETILLSPSKDGAAEEYTKYVPFTDLGNILSGDGIPKSINIDITDPKAPLQEVQGFRLGETISPVTGTYKVLVPFELADSSRVLYSDSLDGWNDEDLDYLTVEKLGLDVIVNSDIALDMQLTVYPMVIKNGKSVKLTSGITTTSAKIPASAKGTAVTALVEGVIEHLDGIVIEAILLGVEDSKVLAPKSFVKLNDLKITVSGHYDKEL